MNLINDLITHRYFAYLVIASLAINALWIIYYLDGKKKFIGFIIAIIIYGIYAYTPIEYLSIVGFIMPFAMIIVGLQAYYENDHKFGTHFLAGAIGAGIFLPIACIGVLVMIIDDALDDYLHH